MFGYAHSRKEDLMTTPASDSTHATASTRVTHTAEDQALLPVVVSAIQAAGRKIQSRFSIASRPANRDELASALDANDAASLEILKPALMKGRPGATWIEDEEEDGELPAGECWLTDPVEGNINHVHGMTEWGVTATLVRDNIPVLTAVYWPMSDNLYTAVRGGGAYLDGVRLCISGKTDLAVALVGTGQAKPGEDREIYRQLGQSVTAMLHDALLVRASVPVTLTLLQVAAGRMDAFWQYGQVSVGLLPGALLVEEAGGTITDTRGCPWTTASKDFLAAAPGLHAATVKTLSSVPAPG
jgi:myo-inositol-1(or 4)-monophosphatase